MAVGAEVGAALDNKSGDGVGTVVDATVGVCKGIGVDTSVGAGLGTAVGASVGDGMDEHRFDRGQSRWHGDWCQRQRSADWARAAHADQTIMSSGRSVGTT